MINHPLKFMDRMLSVPGHSSFARDRRLPSVSLPRLRRLERRGGIFHKHGDFMENREILFRGLLIFGLAGVVGCQSARQPGSMSHAFVQIQNHSLAEIQEATTAVLHEAGYALTLSTSDEMVFDRLGSRWDAFKWGGWITGQGVTMRVKVRVSEPPTGGCLLQANAYAVQDADDPLFESESRNVLLNRRPYQKLLDEVAKRLK